MTYSNPYSSAIDHANSVMSNLIEIMVSEQDMKVFKNIAAVYVFWQHEAHCIQLSALNYERSQ